MSADTIEFIDLDRIIASKAGKKAKYFPRFVVSWLKRVIHQDQLNDFLKVSKGAEGLDFLAAALDSVDISLSAAAEEFENGKCGIIYSSALVSYF